MARFVQAGPSAGLAVISPHAFVASNEDFFRARVMQAYDPNSEAGRIMLQEALQRTEAINGFAAMQAAKAAAQQIRSMNGIHDYVHLHTVQDFQTAPLTMVNWIMTDEYLLNLYRRGQIEGWSDTFVDHSPGDSGVDSVAYAVLNNGLLMPHQETGWVCHNYNIDWSGFEPLTIRDVDFVKSAQQRLTDLINNSGEGDEDPTSQYGAKF